MSLTFSLTSADEPALYRLLADLTRQAVNDAVSPFSPSGGKGSRKAAAIALRAKRRSEAWEFFSSPRFSQLCGWAKADAHNARQLALGEIRRRRAEREQQ